MIKQKKRPNTRIYKIPTNSKENKKKTISADIVQHSEIRKVELKMTNNKEHNKRNKYTIKIGRVVDETTATRKLTTI